MVATNALLAAALTGAAVASAIPASNKLENIQKGRATVKQVKRENYQFNGPLSVYKTYLKYKTPIPEWLASAVANSTGLNYERLLRRDEGSATTTPIDSYDDAYITPVSIGTPAQVLNLDFDTGSSDLWVFSSLTASADIDGQSVYTPSDSSTSKKLSGYTWDISYGDGSSSSGVVYTDKVAIGGVTVTSQAVECAKTVSSSFTEESAMDGLVGLGFNSLNTVSPESQNTFWYNALDNLDEPVFCANLKHDEAGTYDFGFIDSSAYTGDLTYVDVDTDPGYWTFTSSGYQVGDNDFVDDSITGIADTGTTLLYLPSSVNKAYYAKVSGATHSASEGGWIFDCDADLPDFTFGVGDSTITIPAEYMTYETISGNTCFGGLQPSTDIGINIFGDVALKAAYVVFNGDTPSLGWAQKASS
ncbi:Endothiapepsin [Cytospora mali]|uniref:Endothiapepsin n=1 Tax=Cytospora mali TaxID=578113 RepID=A0A194WBQ8_CYTMA|nr:Endothiapepsin [Valsa mali]